MALVKVVMSEDDIAALVETISDVCDGQPAALILVALADMLAMIADSAPGLSLDMVVADFNGLLLQRHGSSNGHSVN